MFKPSKYVNDICPSCHPREYVKTISEFKGKSETYEDLPEANHHLYKCVKCGEKVWLDEQWIKNNAVEVEEKKEGEEETTMGRFEFELNIDLTTNLHIGSVLITDNRTGEMKSSKQLEGTSLDELVKKAQGYKERFLLNMEVLENEK